MISDERPEWRLCEWNDLYHGVNHIDLPPMTREEIKEAKAWLRDRRYPIPADCPGEACPKHRPSCKLGACHIAVGMCGDL
jgi:hypothetical protein